MFEVSQKQWDKIDEWVRPIINDKYTGAIGGAITYSFTPTSLGVVLRVSCLGKEKDFTEYVLW